MKLDGDILNGRLVLYADSLALGLKNLIEKLEEVGDPLTLAAFGKDAVSILREITSQVAAASLQYAAPPEDPPAAASSSSERM